MNELIFDRESVKKAMRESMLQHTVKVFSGPEGNAELPDEGLPEDIEEDDNDSGNDTDESEGD